MFRPKLGQEYKGTFLTSERNDYLSSHRTLKAYLNLRQSLLKDDCRDDFKLLEEILSFLLYIPSRASLVIMQSFIYTSSGF